MTNNVFIIVLVTILIFSTTPVHSAESNRIDLLTRHHLEPEPSTFYIAGSLGGANIRKARNSRTALSIFAGATLSNSVGFEIARINITGNKIKTFFGDDDIKLWKVGLTKSHALKRSILRTDFSVFTQVGLTKWEVVSLDYSASFNTFGQTFMWVLAA